MNKALISILFLCIAGFLLDEAFALSCKDENGLPEDWFVMYKIPRRKSKLESIKKGGGYSFITAKTSKKQAGWFLSEYDLNDNNSMTHQTLKEVYDNPEQFSYVQYNDEKPEKFGHKNSIGFAHAKGALVWNNDEALWLIHSAPKFTPDFADKTYAYPPTARTYGQNFMCISLNSKESVNKILNHLVQMEAQVYTAHLGPLNSAFQTSIDSNFRILESWLNRSKSGSNVEITPEKFQNTIDQERLNDLVATVESKEGNKFILFSKNKKDLFDLYYGLASQYLGVQDMSVKFWSLLQKKEALLSSTCSKTNRVKNIKELEFKYINRPDVIHWRSNDHSKWSVCNDDNTPCYCAGDMNRATTQIRRGGGLVCMINKEVRDTFRSTYKNEISCSDQVENNPFFK